MSLKVFQFSRSPPIVFWPFRCLTLRNGFQTGQCKCVGIILVHLSCASSSVRLVSLLWNFFKVSDSAENLCFCSCNRTFSDGTSLLGRGRGVFVYPFLKVHKVSLFWPSLILIPGQAGLWGTPNRRSSITLPSRELLTILIRNLTLPCQENWFSTCNIDLSYEFIKFLNKEGKGVELKNVEEICAKKSKKLNCFASFKQETDLLPQVLPGSSDKGSFRVKFGWSWDLLKV